MTDETNEEAPHLLEGIFKILRQHMPRYVEEKICPQCNTTLSHVRATGKLGCDQCQEKFASELAYFFIQDKQTEKTDATREQLLMQLHEAIKKEDYELAAILRDQVKSLN